MNCDKGITRGGHLLSKIIRRVRRTADMSQRELAKHAGVSASAIGDLETGAVTPSLAVLQRILNAANYRLVVVDAGGRLVLPLEVWQDVTDLAGRRFPAHLDTILDPELGEWWADSYGLTRPSETFRRNRAARTTNAESANGRCARPSSDSRRTRGVRPVGGRATNGATTAQRIRNSTNGGRRLPRRRPRLLGGRDGRTPQPICCGHGETTYLTHTRTSDAFFEFDHAGNAGTREREQRGNASQGGNASNTGVSVMRRRRRMLIPLAVLGAVLALAGCTGRAQQIRFRANLAGRRPNIVFVLTDDLSWNLVRYMPHVQAMEAEGSTFSRFYVVDSLCCPSRSAIFTGEYPHDDGVFSNSGAGGGYPAFQTHHDARASYALSLQKAGYRTGFMGKYLNGYVPTYPIPPGWTDWDVTGWGYPEFNYHMSENGTIHGYGNQPKDYLTDVLSRKASSFIDNAAAAHKSFALEVATFAPHSPDVPAPRDAGTFPGLHAPRSPAYDRMPTDPPAWLKRFPPLTAVDKSRIDWWFRRRVETVQAVDRMIGHLQATLRKDGVAGDTYFVFSSDNGYHMGEHRLHPGKETAFETDIRVPLMVIGPHVPAGRRVAAMTSSIDLAPTFDAIAGRREPASADGVSMLGLWHGRPAPTNWQRAVLIEHHGPVTSPSDPDYQLPLSASPPSYEAVRTTSALYVHYDRGGEEYYDTARDPYELHNIVATIPRVKLRRMRAMLTALVHCHGHAQCQAAATGSPAR